MSCWGRIRFRRTMNGRSGGVNYGVWQDTDLEITRGSNMYTVLIGDTWWGLKKGTKINDLTWLYNAVPAHLQGDWKL